MVLESIDKVWLWFIVFFKIEDEKKISTTDNCQRNAEVRLFGEKIANYMRLFDKKNENGSDLLKGLWYGHNWFQYKPIDTLSNYFPII